MESMINKVVRDIDAALELMSDEQKYMMQSSPEAFTGLVKVACENYYTKN